MSITIIGKGKTDSALPSSLSGIQYNKKIISENFIPDGATSVTVSDIPQTYNEISVEFSNIYSSSGAGDLQLVINGENALGTYAWSVLELDSTPAVNSVDITQNASTALGSNNTAANSILNIRTEVNNGVPGNASLTINIPNYTSQISSKNVFCFAKSVIGNVQTKYFDGLYVPRSPVRSIRLESTAAMTSGAYAPKQTVKVYGITYGS